MQVCWTTDTYYLPDTSWYLPKEGEHGKLGAKMVGYYQWVALILMCQACLFYLPRPIWRLCNKKSGIAVSTITDAAIEYQRKMDTDGRDKTMRYMVKNMGRYLLEMSRNRAMSGKCKSIWFAFYGNYLILLYIFVKILYIFNAIVQVFLLNNFLGMDYHAYGIAVMKQLSAGERWTTSDRFPRVTFCDFKIRVVGNIQRYTVQCSLPMNLLNEIIFIFLWFWFAFVALATIGSLLMWLATAIYEPYQVKYVRTRLIAMDKFGNAPKGLVAKFVKDYLRRDGTFIIRLVSKNAGDMIAAELICGLWEYFKDHKKSLVVTSQYSGDELQLIQKMEDPPEPVEIKPYCKT